MKIRSDFVSNSSSCSFVIDTDISKFGKIVSVFSKIDIPYSFEQDISISLEAKNKNVIALRQLLCDLECCNNDYCTDIEKLKEKANKYPDELSWDTFSMSFEKLSMLPEQAFDYIDRIYFSSEDYGSAPMQLKMLYDFCAINDCHPNDEDSEHSFVYGDYTNSFYKLMHQKIDSGEHHDDS